MPAVQPYLDDVLKKAKANVSVNPYAGLFDYDEMVREEEARKLKLQEGQKKIQRTNAIGDALRLVAEGVTGSMGASIIPRPVNPGIMQASQRINELEDRSQSNMDRIRLQDLAMREKGLTYDLGQKATQQQREWETGQTAEKNKFAAEEAEKGRVHQKEIAQINADAGIARTRIAGQYSYQEASLKQKEQQQEGGVDGQNPYNRKWTQLYGKKAPYMTLSDVESGENIPLTDGQAMQIAKWMRSDPAIDQRTKMQIDATDLTNNLVFKQMVADNWDRYGDLVRKMALGEKINLADQQNIIETGKQTARLKEYQTRVAQIDPTKRKGAKDLSRLNAEYADVLQAQQPVAPVVQQMNPVEAVKGILPDAQTIYSKAESADQVMNDLKALINTRFQDASPQEKADIYNDLIKQF